MHLRNPFLSLGAKVQALVGAGFLIGFVLALFYHIQQQTRTTLDAMHEAQTRVVTSLAGPISGALAPEQESVIYAYMELMSADPRAAGLAISSHGVIVKTQQSIDHMDLDADLLSKLALQAEDKGDMQYLDTGDFSFVATPVRDSGQRIVGSLAVGWSGKGVLSAIWAEAVWEALALATILTALLISVLALVRRIVVRPLNVISAQLEASATPDAALLTTVHQYETHTDEVGALARALSRFNEGVAEKNKISAQLDVALSNMSQGLCLFDDSGRLAVANTQYAEMYGISRDVLRQGAPREDIAAASLSAGLLPAHLRDKAFGIPDFSSSEPLIFDLADGRTIACSVQPIGGGGWVETHSDITHLRRIEKQLSHMASHDGLTDLPNARQFRASLDAILKQRHGQDGLAVLFIDLDRFKAVNDSLGHSIGDQLLQQVAGRLRSCARNSDIVGRLGGDEFGVVQTGGRQPEAAEALAIRVREAIAEPFDIEGHRVLIGTSVGIALPTGEEDGEALLQGADLALNVAKVDGRNVHRFFDTEMGLRRDKRRHMEHQLRAALENQEFELYYQPLVNLESGRITCFEALVRWNHPARGIVPPGDFIPIAEEAGLIARLGDWVIREACRTAAKWPADVRVAVNVSPTQFRSGDLAQTVFSALSAAHLSPSRLEIEVTENVLLKEDSTTLLLLHRLRSYGVRIAIDDFGTGYSALSYLQKFPFDKVKIDRSFVNDLTEANCDSPIINAVASISRSLKMSTVAEGVETELQRKLVAAAGITEIQGYLVSEPVRAPQVIEILTQTKTAMAS